MTGTPVGSRTVGTVEENQQNPSDVSTQIMYDLLIDWGLVFRTWHLLKHNVTCCCNDLHRLGHLLLQWLAQTGSPVAAMTCTDWVTCCCNVLHRLGHLLCSYIVSVATMSGTDWVIMSCTEWVIMSPVVSNHKAFAIKDPPLAVEGF